MFTTSIKSAIGLGLAGITAATSLSGCMISDNPAVNTIATVAAVGTVASLIYSVSDGYYYNYSDGHYNRMPRGYRPDSGVDIMRVNDIGSYRQQYPHGPGRMNQGGMQQGQRPQQPGQQGQQRPQMQQGQMNGQRPQMQPGQQRPQQMQQQQRPNNQQRPQQQQRRMPDNNGNNPFERNN
ncbi:hypothetical protein [Neisseria perflava]|uniref:hypothetical protein n=1 Tax=Neisseria perflava TaxID=33053 RepID=UPI00209D670A|nr:hypothetical protein [Neisseria perflava]MCP1660501.1 hypothetical protein [Neisseria perflava]